jgi:hypothetical protein
MKSKEDNKRGRQNMKVYFLIANMIVAVFAFSWIVSADWVRGSTSDGKYTAWPDGQYADQSKWVNNPSGNMYMDTESGFVYTVSQYNTAFGVATQGAADKKSGGTADLTSQAPSAVLTAAQLGNPFKSSTIDLPKDFALKTPDGAPTGKIIDKIQKIDENNWNALGKDGKPLGQITTTELNTAGVYPEDIIGGYDWHNAPTFNINGEIPGRILKDQNLALADDGALYKLGDDKETWVKSGTSAAPTGVGGTIANAIFGTTEGLGANLVKGAVWAGVAYGAGQLIGGLAGMDTSQTAGLSNALAAGAFAMRFTETQGWAGPGLFAKEGAKSIFGLGSFGVGLVVAGIMFAATYKEESKEYVSFTCEPWQAPIGGADCEKCNDAPGCSDYKCRSLGQACKLLNVGTTEERCAWVNPKDAKSPGISPWENILTEGYVYSDVRIRPPGDGSEPGRMTIEKKGGGCVEAFTPIEFGIVTTGPDGEDEPAQCMIDYNHTENYTDMTYKMGESDIYGYNHSQKLSLPSPSSVKAAAPGLEHDGTYSLYVRCRDANGNENKDEFVVRFCVDPSQDTTPPKIEGTSIANGMPVKFNQSTVNIDVYVNEPSECRWSRDDKSYDQMETPMQCSNKFWEMNNNLVYTCKTNLTGVKSRQDNVFYFRCKDQPGAEETKRNKMEQSYKYTLIGTEPLNIIDVKPNGTIKGSTSVVSVNVEVKTSNGYKNGEAICYFSETQNEADYVKFFETGTSKHTQRLDLAEGNYKYYIKCLDLGGNRDDNSTEFTVDVDTESPTIVRVYQENLLLKLITAEDSNCKYSIDNCNFKFEDGLDMPYPNQTEHFAEWKTENTYYIRCSDEYGNIPVSNTCSLIVRPYDVVEAKEED